MRNFVMNELEEVTNYFGLHVPFYLILWRRVESNAYSTEPWCLGDNCTVGQLICDDGITENHAVR